MIEENRPQVRHHMNAFAQQNIPETAPQRLIHPTPREWMRAKEIEKSIKEEVAAWDSAFFNLEQPSVLPFLALLTADWMECAA